MQQTKTLLVASALLSLTTLTAEAALTAGIADGKSVVYSSISDITWTGDANLLGTMIKNQGYSTVVNAIIAASPVVYDTPNFYDGSYYNSVSYSGQYALSADDFNSSYWGQTSWFGANAFTTYLNSISYAGSNQWDLPTAGANPIMSYNKTDGQFGQLYYNELNALSPRDSNGSNYGILSDGSFLTSGTVGPFTNAQTYGYWLDTEYAPYPEYAWLFDTDDGEQWYYRKSPHLYAWAVSPRNVATLPVPAAVWLFGSGLIGLVGWRRRGNIG